MCILIFEAELPESMKGIKSHSSDQLWSHMLVFNTRIPAMAKCYCFLCVCLEQRAIHIFVKSN